MIAPHRQSQQVAYARSTPSNPLYAPLTEVIWKNGYLPAAPGNSLVFLAEEMEPSPALPIYFVAKGGLPQKPPFRVRRAGAFTVAVAVTENWHCNGRRRLMSNAEHIYSIADNHAQTLRVCIDRLHELGANAQLKLLTGKLQELAVRATPGDDDKGTKAARRQRGRPQNLKEHPAKGS